MMKKIKKKVVTFLNSKIFNANNYWEKRYRNGGNSGVGSYGDLALYKASIINEFVDNHQIVTVLEFGSGDGNQLSLYKFPQYTGLDISKSAIKLCKEKYANDISKKFIHLDRSTTKLVLEKAELVLSIDVLFHLIKYNDFTSYIDNLFDCSNKYVIIYSTNFDCIYDSPHQIDREFTKYIENKIKDFILIKNITNPFKGAETMSDFYIYKKVK